MFLILLFLLFLLLHNLLLINIIINKFPRSLQYKFRSYMKTTIKNLFSPTSFHFSVSILRLFLHSDDPSFFLALVAIRRVLRLHWSSSARFYNTHKNVCWNWASLPLLSEFLYRSTAIWGVLALAETHWFNGNFVHFLSLHISVYLF